MKSFFAFLLNLAIIAMVGGALVLLARLFFPDQLYNLYNFARIYRLLNFWPIYLIVLFLVAWPKKPRD